MTYQPHQSEDASLKPVAVPTHLPAGDWTEDAPHENGNYWCRCCVCENLFVGHKRRVVCKVCAKGKT